MINDREKLSQALFMPRVMGWGKVSEVSQSRRVAEYHIVMQSEDDLVEVPLNLRNSLKGLGNIKDTK
jgi:hypothetical protein